MVLKAISLQNFRSYRKKEFKFSSGTTLVVGPNTSGKTNLLEAIYLLATGKSFRAGVEAEMIRSGEELARAQAVVAQSIARQGSRSAAEITHRNFGSASDSLAKKNTLLNEAHRRSQGEVSQNLVGSPQHSEVLKLEILLTTGQVGNQKTAKKRYFVNGVGKRLWYCPFLFDSVQTVGGILERVRELNLKIIAITDHDSLEGFRRAEEMVRTKKLNLLLIPAMEVSSKGGHILAYGIKKEIPKGLSAERTINLIHEQGGLAVAPHPYCLFSFGDKIFRLDFDAIEAFNSQIGPRATKKALSAAERLGLPALAGSDAHQLEWIGRGLTLFPETTRTIADVLIKIKKGDFKIDFTRINLPKMVLKHFAKNFQMQVLR
jgi:predicted metal-dependent phosphoesterase TrpH